MIQLNDPALKRALIEKHHFQEHFSLDLEECSVLLRCEAGEILCHSIRRSSCWRMGHS